MDEIAVRIAEHLHFDVAGTHHHFFQIDLVVAESCRRLAARHLDRRRQFGFVVDGAHAAAAAAPARLQHQRIADPGRELPAVVQVAGKGAGGRHHRHAHALGQRARCDLVAQFAHHLGLGADEGDASPAAGIGEVGILGKETVAGVDGVDLGQPGDADDVVDVQIGLDGFPAFADQIAFIRLRAVQGKTVLVRVDAHGADAEFAGGAHDANGDFRAVGDQETADVLVAHGG